MKEASTDGPSGLLQYNIEMLYCKFVFFLQIKCLLACSQSVEGRRLSGSKKCSHTVASTLLATY